MYGTAQANSYLAKRWREKEHKRHRAAIRLMRPVVDNHEPRAHPHLVLKLKKLQLAEERIANVDRDNRLMLDKICATMKVHRYQCEDIDTYRQRSLMRERQREHIRIVHENQAILKRLDAIQTSLDPQTMKKDFQRSRLVKQNISRFNRKQASGSKRPKRSQRQNKDTTDAADAASTNDAPDQNSLDESLASISSGPATPGGISSGLTSPGSARSPSTPGSNRRQRSSMSHSAASSGVSLASLSSASRAPPSAGSLRSIYGKRRPSKTPKSDDVDSHGSTAAGTAPTVSTGRKAKARPAWSN